MKMNSEAGVQNLSYIIILTFVSLIAVTAIRPASFTGELVGRPMCDVSDSLREDGNNQTIEDLSFEEDYDSNYWQCRGALHAGFDPETVFHY